MRFLRYPSRLLVLFLFVAAPAFAAVQHPPGAAIASAHEAATKAGFEILEEGGNAFDAAVAVSAALAVVEPTSSGIGGGGFWLLHLADGDRDVFVDGREKAPGAAGEDMYLDENGKVDRSLATTGPLSAGIPGEPAALVHLAEKYGRLPLAKSLAPAIRLAENGFPANPKFLHALEVRREAMERWEAAPEVFLPGGEMPAEGDPIMQPDLGRTLRALAEKGRAGFYAGDVAGKLVKGTREAGGIWTMKDLADYRVVEREPVTFIYRDGMKVIAAPPPSSGGAALATMLNILEGYDLDRLDPVTRKHLIIEAMRRAYRDRAIYLGDPDFVKVPMDRLTSDFYADGLRASIRLDRATPSSSLPGIESEAEGRHTTHFSIIDSEGNRVAATLTVNLYFGSAFMAPGTGVLLNDEMDDFSSKQGSPNAFGLIGGAANAIEPGKRPLSSMSPTFAIKGDRVAVLGTPGGSRIITMVLLGLLDFYDGHGPRSWVSVPRFHHQYEPDQVSCEPKACPPEIAEGLRKLGHDVKQLDRTWGNMHAVMWDRGSNTLEAASDPRTSVGYAEVRKSGEEATSQ